MITFITTALKYGNVIMNNPEVLSPISAKFLDSRRRGNDVSGVGNIGSGASGFPPARE